MKWYSIRAYHIRRAIQRRMGVGGVSWRHYCVKSSVEHICECDSQRYNEFITSLLPFNMKRETSPRMLLSHCPDAMTFDYLEIRSMSPIEIPNPSKVT